MSEWIENHNRALETKKKKKKGKSRFEIQNMRKNNSPVRLLTTESWWWKKGSVNLKMNQRKDTIWRKKENKSIGPGPPVG